MVTLYFLLSFVTKKKKRLFSIANNIPFGYNQYIQSIVLILKVSIKGI